jgi:acetyl esterase/lipase
MKYFFTVLVFFSIYQLEAQEITMPLWPEGKVPNHLKSALKEKRDTSETIKITLVQSPEITVYLPTKRSATGQAIIICPGGGYSYLSYNWEGTDPARLLCARGIAAIVLKYRLPEPASNVTPHLSPLMDAQRAMRMVRRYASKWGINKNNIGIMGFSAGGHLASSLATHFDIGDAASKDSIEQQSSRPDFVVLVYPVVSMSKPIMHKGSRDMLIGEKADSSLAKFYSSELQVTKETPPTFLIHSTNDKTVPVENSLLFYQALKDNGVKTEMHIYPMGGHGFGLGVGKGYLETWTDRLVEWMRGLGK